MVTQLWILNLNASRRTYIYSSDIFYCLWCYTNREKYFCKKPFLVNSENLLRPTPKVTYLFYKFWQPIYDVMKENGTLTNFKQNILEMTELLELMKSQPNNGGTIVIFDDMGTEIKNHVDDFTCLLTVIVII